MQKHSNSKNKIKKILFGIATLGLVTFIGTKAGKVINNKNRDKEDEKKEIIQEPEIPSDFSAFISAGSP